MAKLTFTVNPALEGQRARKRAENIAKAQEMFKAFVTTYDQTQDRSKAMKAATAICNSPYALLKLIAMLPKNLQCINMSEPSHIIAPVTNG